MRLFRPQFELVLGDGAQPWPGDKIGGLPSGVVVESWPLCAECGDTMSYIAQFRHDPRRLDLGSAARVLTLWQCEHDPGMCETWSSESGANAAFVTELDGRGTSVIEPPDPSTVVYPEARATAWLEDDDGVPAELVPAFYDDSRHGALGDQWWSIGGMDTRLGGVPAWIQSASEGPGPPWMFIGQLSDGQHMHGEPPLIDGGPFGIQRRVGGEFELEPPPGTAIENVDQWIAVDETGWYLPGPNFGDGGMAYLFINRETDPPSVKMFWQCG